MHQDMFHVKILSQQRNLVVVAWRVDATFLGDI
jgi:hypothetical protein